LAQDRGHWRAYESGDEPSVSGATELVKKYTRRNEICKKKDLVSALLFCYESVTENYGI
jgi:hypothetical protein